MRVQRALVTGGAGQLASDLATVLSGRGAEVTAPAHSELDIEDTAAVRRALAAARPEIVLNCAAFHAVDRCESEEERAWAVNVHAVRELAAACAESGARLVHFSTNYVFAGDRGEPYGERDLPAPRSVYAYTKLAGEHAALAYAPGTLVVRSAGLYGAAGNTGEGGNFVARVLARARKAGRLEVVADQRLSPTYTADLAPAVVEALEHDITGVLHLTNSGDCSWHEFTLAIMENAGLDVPVDAVETPVPPRGANRPANGVLVTEAADAAGLTPLRAWRDALDEYMAAPGFADQPV